MSPTLTKLVDRLEYDCDFSDDYVPVIRAIARTREPEAIDILAGLLDSSGPIAVEAMNGLVSFGEAAVPAAQRCVDSDDGAMCLHGEQVLERLACRAARARRVA